MPTTTPTTVERYRPTWAEIDLKAISHNYKAIGKILPKDVKIMAVVKANAYGHGSIEVSKRLVQEGVGYLGVATLDEAAKLRNAGITAPILILGSIFPEEAEAASQYGVTLTLCNYELLEKLVEKDIRIKVHIKVDTGMGRIGVWHEDAVAFVHDVKKTAKNVEVEGICTHFSIAGRDKFFTQYQIDAFNAVIDKLEKKGFRIPVKHAANSIGLVDWKKSHFNMVRPGLILYGMYPKASFAKVLKLKPALSLKTKIVFLKQVPAGRSISYGRTYITQAPTHIATLPIGYADGYGRILSGKAQVLVKGHQVPVVGKVTMDQIMVDVGSVAGVKVGDEVVLIGKQGFSEIKVDQLAHMSGTIPYEIVTGITARVPRIYNK